MANPRQRKKVKGVKLTRRTGEKLKRVNVRAPKVIVDNWDKKQTQHENYKRLGLVLNPNKATKVLPAVDDTGLATGEALIKRDENGNIIDVVYSKASTTAQRPEKTEVIKALEERATQIAPRKPFYSTAELEWIKRIVQKYGDDYTKAARDTKLNPMQQTAASIRKHAEKYKHDPSLL